MELTDEQYQQIFRYADNEMAADELKAFDAGLIENKELRDEVEFYKQIRLLSESVEGKIRAINPWPAEEKKRIAEEPWSMLADARKKWENLHEDELKLKYGINRSTKIPEGTQKNPIRRISISRWLMAASVIVLVSLCVYWWYSEDKKNNSQVVINEKADSTVNRNNLEPDSAKNIIPIQPTPSQENPSSNNIAKDKEKEKQRALFVDYFKPDTAPPDKEGPLETAFVYYENKQFERASREFETADIGPVTRGDQEDYRNLMTFYIHYYQALSYMANNLNISKPISELKKAIITSPNAAWKTKAQWYLALAHLKKGEINSAQALLKQVAGNDGVKELKQKAIALSEAL